MSTAIAPLPSSAGLREGGLANVDICVASREARQLNFGPMKRKLFTVAAIILFGLPVRAEQPKSLFYLTRDPKSVRSFLAHADKIDILVPAWYSVDSNGLVSVGPHPLV